MPPATMPGAASAISRCMSGVRRGRSSGKLMPKRAAAKATTTICNRPDAAMPQASTTPARPLIGIAAGDEAEQHEMSTTLSRLGVKAAMAKRPSAFSTPV